jgi:hypothetical protein
MGHALEVVLFGAAFVGVLLTLLGVPGNFGPVAIALGYYLFDGAPRFTGTIVLVFLAVAVSGEVVEQLASIWGAKRFGGSTAGMLGAFLGSILGGIAGTAVLPALGTVLGVFAGCFALTMAFEVGWAGRDLDDGVRAGLGAVLGKAFSVAYKYAAGFALLGLLAWRFWFV